MICIDLNVLLYAIDEESARHAAARSWLEAELSGSRPVGLAWSVILGFIRIASRPGVLRRPMESSEAIAYVDEWLALPGVAPLVPTASHWRILRDLLAASGAAGNLTSDAHLAALAIEHGAALASFDHDFRRFPGVRLEVPGEK